MMIQLLFGICAQIVARRCLFAGLGRDYDRCLVQVSDGVCAILIAALGFRAKTLFDLVLVWDPVKILILIRVVDDLI